MAFTRFSLVLAIFAFARCALAEEDHALDVNFHGDHAVDTNAVDTNAVDMPEEEHFEGADFNHSLETDALRALHSHFDIDKDGHVSLVEFGEYAEKMKKDVLMQELPILLAMNDKDKDDKLSFEEFLGAIKEMEPDDEEAPNAEDKSVHLRERFAMADENGDSFLEGAEVVAGVFPDTNEKVLVLQSREQFRQLDKDGDSKLSSMELYSLPHFEIAAGDDHEPHTVEYIVHSGKEFKFLDKDEDGFLSPTEFVDSTIGRFDEVTRHNELFAMADSNADGYLTADELADAKEAITQGEMSAEFFTWKVHHEL